MRISDWSSDVGDGGESRDDRCVRDGRAGTAGAVGECRARAVGGGGCADRGSARRTAWRRGAGRVRERAYAGGALGRCAARRADAAYGRGDLRGGRTEAGTEIGRARGRG